MEASLQPMETNYTLLNGTSQTVGYNYHFNDDCYFRVDPKMQGPLWIRNPVIQQIHPGTRLIYLVDQDNNFPWNPNITHIPNLPSEFRWVPRELSTILESRTSGITTTWTIHADPRLSGEIWKIQLTNTRSSRCRLLFSPAIPLSQGGHMGKQVIWHQDPGFFSAWSFPLHAEYEQYEELSKLPHSTLCSMQPVPHEVCTGSDSYYRNQPAGDLPGFLKDFDTIQSLKTNSTEPGIFSGVYSIELEPGESWDWFCVLTQQIEPTFPPDSLIQTNQQWQSSLDESLKWYKKISGPLTIKTPEPRLDSMINTWLKKEIIWETRLWRNGITTPWRNELQDALGYSLYSPEQALPYLKRVTRNQEPSGYLKVWNTRDGEKPNHPLAGKRHTDGGIWLVICWIQALRISGNWDWLNIQIPYIDGSITSLHDHLHRALDFSYQDRGAHGLVLMHDGDWTDPLNGPGRKGRGESGWASQALVFALELFSNLTHLTGREEVSKLSRERAREVQNCIQEHLWCGDRFAYGFDDSGLRFGDHRDGRTYLNTQSWGLMTFGDTYLDQLKRVIHSLKTPYGPRLFDPHFKEWDPQVGRISLKIPGTTENASVYCHASAFVAYSLAKNKQAEDSVDILLRTIPGHRDHRKDIPQQLPIYQPNSYFSMPGHPQDGTSTGTLGTGTCTWMVLTIFEQYFGLGFTPEGLVCQPKLPETWPSAEISFVRQSTTFTIGIRRGAEMKSLTVNRIPTQEMPIPWKGQKSMFIEINMGPWGT